MAYEAYDVVVVPFPFTDRESTKRRPALVLSKLSSFSQPSAHSVLAMITSEKNDPWPLDTRISDLASAGLSAASVLRMKLFTLDNRLILKKIGILAPNDQKAFQINLDHLLATS